MYSSININIQYFVRPTKGCLILVPDILAQHGLVIDVIGAGLEICFRSCCSSESNVVYVRVCTPSLQCVGH
jgi:hypothetical protein